MPTKDKDEWVAKALKVPVSEIRRQTGENAPLEDRRSRVYLINESKLTEKQKIAAKAGLGVCDFELEIYVKDHEGQPMEADFIGAFCESKDIEKTSTSGKLERGYYYVKMTGAPSGNIFVNASHINGGKHNKSAPRGNCPYTIKKGKVVLQAVQTALDSSESKTSKQSKDYNFGGEFEEEVGGEIDIAGQKFGGKGVRKSSHGTTTGFGEERTKSTSGKEPGKAFEVKQIN
jgi:hypothetical protein